MGDDPGPARSLPAEPAPELPTPRWGVDLNEAEREVRSVIRAAPFGRKRPTPAARLGETVPLPRPLVRLGLFSREDNPPPTAGTHLTLPGGELHISGARPSWRDLRVVLILTALTGVREAHRDLPATDASGRLHLEIQEHPQHRARPREPRPAVRDQGRLRPQRFRRGRYLAAARAHHRPRPARRGSLCVAPVAGSPTGARL